MPQSTAGDGTVEPGKNSRIRVSIAVPAHNEERYIAGCLRSLVHQRTAAELEIIVCLNACTDRTGEVVMRFIRRNGVRIELVREPLKGVARARQRAFAQAHGEIVLSADADTEYPPDWVARVVADFRRDPRTVLVYGPVRFRSLHGTTGILLRCLYPVLDFLATKIGKAIGRPNVCGANFAVRREAFDRVGGFDTGLKIFEDNELARKLREIGRVHYDPQLTVYTSARRYDRYGFSRTVAYYTLSYLRAAIFRRPPGEFRDVRAPQ